MIDDVINRQLKCNTTTPSSYSSNKNNEILLSGLVLNSYISNKAAAVFLDLNMTESIETKDISPFKYVNQKITHDYDN